MSRGSMSELRYALIDLLRDKRMRTDITSANLADSILALPEMVKLREKAEIFDSIKSTRQEWVLGGFEDLVNRSKDLSTIMSGLVVEEKCEHIVNTGDYLTVTECVACHGMGYNTRPATPQEVREVITHIFTNSEAPRRTWNQNNQVWIYDFLLKSGGRMRLEGKENRNGCR